MARMPGAVWRPLADNWASMPRIRAHDIFCLHTMVGSLEGTDGYFRSGNGAGYTGTESHFGVGHDGTIYQWQDTDYQADANYQGGWHIISSENADIGTGFPKWNTNDGNAVPAFTDAQVEANARIAAWLNKTHGIPVDLIPDSKVGRRGMGWHRQGVPGYVVPAGELWSKSPGKVCPGSRRIAQIPAISARAKELLGTPGPIPAPVLEDDLMFAISTSDTKRVYIKDGFDLWHTGDGELAGAVGKIQQVTLNQRQVDVLAADVARRYRDHLARVTKATSGDDVDLKALTADLVAGLTPVLVGALADKGAGLSRADVESVVRGVFGDAAVA